MTPTEQVYNAILVALKQLPTDKWLEVRDFVDFLHTNYVSRPSTRRRFSRFAGVWSDEDAAQISKAIEQGCEQIDASQW